MSAKILSFWQAYLASLPPGTKESELTYSAWSFGSSPRMANELGKLVLQGQKTATTSLLWEFEAGSEPLPRPGDLSIILDGRRKPLCIIETLEVEIKPFNQVDERFACDEGEGDRSLAYWRSVHWEFFWRSCAKLGLRPREDMPVVCERFRQVYPKGDNFP